MGFVGQRRDELEDGNTVFEEISEGHEEIKIGQTIMKMRNYVAAV